MLGSAAAAMARVAGDGAPWRQRPAGARPGPRALADAIVALAGDPARRAAMGAEGRRRAETEFASERINEETLRVYERALALGG